MIVAGNLIEQSDENQQKQRGNTTLNQVDFAEILRPMKDADLYLAQLAANVRVDVMPGFNDPSNFSLPQQPLNKALLPASARFESLSRATNPFLKKMGNLRYFLNVLIRPFLG